MPEPLPYDDARNVIPHDSREIVDDDLLIRGIPEGQIKNGRISSGAFRSSSKERDPHRGMSIDIEKIVSEESYQSGPYVGSVQFAVSIPRGHSLLVGCDPLPENEAHGQIWRVEDGPKPMTGGQTRSIHRSCVWHVEIEGVSIR
ncbi:hypothetical protein GCM10011309_02210 [Litorimonas cladophorae]|uniref:Uncharacterized protein n=1 Tax=Litorimonas cladophorae TaxID=1220491 RepID=A0A918KAL6_9PROT|nr:hypothetical protein GCM10011309_02210 [Litorimonas cladophorae]